jgi:hypothetical protein
MERNVTLQGAEELSTVEFQLHNAIKGTAFYRFRIMYQ